jgi:integrase
MNEGNRPAEDADHRRAELFTDHYDTQTYGRAITYACDLAAMASLPAELQRAKGETRPQWRARLGHKWAGVLAWRRENRWQPNRLRHLAATNLRRDHGIDLAQTILGHRLGSGVTEIYAEANIAAAAAVMQKIG